MEKYFKTLIVVKGASDKNTELLVKVMAQATNKMLLADATVFKTESADTFTIGVGNCSNYTKKKAENWLMATEKLFSSYKDGGPIDIEMYSEIEIFEDGTVIAAKRFFKDTISSENPFDEYFIIMMLMIKDDFYTSLEKKKINIPSLIANDTLNQ